MELIGFEEFKNNMNWVAGDFTDQQLRNILDGVDVGVFDSFKEAILIAEALGVTIFTDINLHSVLAYFTSAGYEADEIINMISVNYGITIDLHLCNDGVYVAIVG